MTLLRIYVGFFIINFALALSPTPVYSQACGAPPCGGGGGGGQTEITVNGSPTATIHSTSGDVITPAITNSGDVNVNVQYDQSPQTELSVTVTDQFTIKASGGGGPFDILVRTSNTKTGSGGNIIFDYTDTTGGGYIPQKPVSDLQIEGANINGAGWDGAFSRISLSGANQAIVTNNSKGKYKKNDALDIIYNLKNTTASSMPAGNYTVSLVWTVKR